MCDGWFHLRGGASDRQGTGGGEGFPLVTAVGGALDLEKNDGWKEESGSDGAAL